MTTNSQVRKDITRIKNKINDPRRWIKGASEMPVYAPQSNEQIDTSYCLIGAMGAHKGSFSPTRHLVAQWMANRLIDKGEFDEAYRDKPHYILQLLFLYNDRSETTWDDIMRLLREAYEHAPEIAQMAPA